MAKPPPSYTAVKLAPAATPRAEPAEDPQGTSAGVPSQPAAAETPQTLPSSPRSGKRRPMEEQADPTVLYLHPEGKMALKRFALDRGSKVRVHDLLLEAVEQWARSKGLDVPFRVPSQRGPKS